jgi:hypothetical protein
MSNRRRLARERLEVYLVHLLMAYRPLIFIAGLLLVVYSMVNLYTSPLLGFTSFLPALYLLLLSNSFPVTLYTARLGAWIGTLWSHEA